MIFELSEHFFCEGEVAFLQGVLRFNPCFWMVNRGGFVVI
jgi:hypothetical protein